MAKEPVNTEGIKKPSDEMVEVLIERTSQNDDPNFYVGFNGKNYVLPKGKSSKVPKCVADEINRAKAAQQHMDDTIDSMLSAMNEKTIK